MPDIQTARKQKVGDGTPGPGRPRGSSNKTTTILKDAILLAAQEVGEDGKGKGALVGYLKFLAREEAKSFSALLGRVLPYQVIGDAENPLEVRYADPIQRRARMAELLERAMSSDDSKAA